MQTTIFRNEDRVSTEEVLNLFTQTLEKTELFEKSEIEELSDIVAKNPADKFIVSEKPNVPVMQGDLLIWSDITDEFKREFPRVKDLTSTSRMVLQDYVAQHACWQQSLDGYYSETNRYGNYQ
jgi:hypothetical protein